MKRKAKAEAISTRERILKAAIELFWEKGYEATGMAELLSRAKVNSGSFYYFYKSKEGLLLAVLDWYLVGLEPVLLAPVYEKVEDPIERIFELLAGYRRSILLTDCTFGCPIGRLALEISPQQKAVHRKLAQNFDNWAAAVTKCLTEAKDRLPADVDRERLGNFVLTVMEGGVMLARSHRSVRPFDEAVAELRSYFDRLLGLPSPHPAK